MTPEFIVKIIGIKDETPDVKTFSFKRPKSLDFISGQYCLLSFMDNRSFDSDTHPFTFSSSPTEKSYFTLTIKKMHEFTSKLHKLAVGDEVKIDGPYGISLNFDDNVKEDIIFIAGGSGITPFMSSVRYISAKKMLNKIFLFYSNRTKEDIIFFDELSKIEKVNKNIKIINTLTEKCETGFECARINKEIILKYVNNPNDFLYYICGPPPMIEAIKTILYGLGITDEKMRIEDWQLPGKGESK